MTNKMVFYNQLFSKAVEYFRADFIAFTALLIPDSRFDHWVKGGRENDIHNFQTIGSQNSLAAQVIATARQKAVTSYSLFELDEYCPFMSAEKLESYLGSPVFMHKRCIGVFEVFSSRSRIWSKQERINCEVCATAISRINPMLAST